jgi:D-tyrosyl-tRNA(Tyr) deacylase
MRAVVQRVSRGEVRIDGAPVGKIDRGLVVLVAAGEGDDETAVQWTAEKIATLRIFPDDAGQMNRSVADVGGAILAVSQFTLYGDCRKGRRPSFVRALEPVAAEKLYDRFVAKLRETGIPVETGRFRADMQVELINDGPVTLLIDSAKEF